MKNITKYLLSFAAASMSVVSCSDYDETSTTPGAGTGVSVLLYANVAGESDSRANITVDGEYFSGQWETADAMGLIVTAPDVATTFKQFTYNEDVAAFEGELPSATNGAWKYVGYYPAYESATADTQVKIPFGNARTQNGNRFNSQHDALVAEVLNYTDADAGKDADGNIINLKFNRLTSILNFDIKNGGSEQVRSLLLTSKTATQKLSAASFDFDAALGAGATATLNAEDQSNSILLTYNEGMAPTLAEINAFFNIPAGNYDELQLDVVTENNKMGSFTINRNDVSKPFVAGKLHKYNKTTPITLTEVVAPSLSWKNQDMDAPHEITVDGDGISTYPISIDIAIPAGLAGLTVDVTSAALAEVGITTLDLFNEKGILGGLIPYNDLGLACCAQIQYTKSMVFDITALIPMITAFTDTAYGTHVFTVHVTDLAGNITTQALTFTYTPAVAYNGDADLWKNTATFNIIPQADGATVDLKYKKSSESTWQTATTVKNSDGTFTASVAPTWAESQNTAGLTIHTPNAATGIFAGHTYDYKLVVNGEDVTGVTGAEGQFTAAAGDAIPDGDMESALPCYTTTGSETTTTWGSGNNSMKKELCTQSTFAGMGGTKCAKMTASQTLGILASGNLFQGTFLYKSFNGTVGFGQKYTYSARPTAMSVKCHATVGIVDVQKGYGGKFAVGEPDKARIFVCIVKWNGRHNTKSGTSAPTGGWDPETATSQAEGEIIGYGSQFISTTSGASMETLIIPIHYYQKTDAAPDANYTMVISASTSAYGDLMNGCSTNVLYVDDFKWVY